MWYRGRLQNTTILAVAVHRPNEGVKDKHFHEAQENGGTLISTEFLDHLKDDINRVERLFLAVFDFLCSLRRRKDLFHHQAAVDQPFVLLSEVLRDEIEVIVQSRQPAVRHVKTESCSQLVVKSLRIYLDSSILVSELRNVEI